MGVHVALLRGINVGGKHKLPMRELARIFESCGCADVETYIQSGNVVFEASAAEARAASRDVADAIEAEFGFASPVIVRSHSVLRRILAGHPLGDPTPEPRFWAVGFLDRTPTAAGLRALEPERFTPDRLEVRGTEVYLHYPNGVARSRLTNAYLDRTLGVVTTVRNWNTATRLLELCERR